jgi:replication factor C small subunit
MNTTHTLWTEKYRPDTLEGYIGNESLRSKIGTFIAKSDVPHLLLSGPAGTGKTTIAKIIVKNIPCEYLYINASDENNVDTVRNKIKSFASSMGFENNKIIVLDECLDENTLVWVLRKGTEVSIPIKNLCEETDLVKSWNIKLNKIEWMRFYLWDKGVQNTMEIELENGEIIVCTPDHKWYVLDETGNILVVKTTDLHKYNHIMSP